MIELFFECLCGLNIRTLCILHIILCIGWQVYKKGELSIITANRIILATGERPRYPDIPGAKEFGITRFALFYLKN